MEGAVYHSSFGPLGIEIVLPERGDRMNLDKIIRTQLIQGEYLPASRRYVEDLILTMARAGAEAVILGCTELPLLVPEERSALPLLDSTRLLAAAALTACSPLASISH
jgi:aspartate racemase